MYLCISYTCAANITHHYQWSTVHKIFVMGVIKNLSLMGMGVFCFVSLIAMG